MLTTIELLARPETTLTLVNPHVLQGLDLPRINKRDPREKGVDPTKIAQPNALVSKSPSTVSSILRVPSTLGGSPMNSIGHSYRGTG